MAAPSLPLVPAGSGLTKPGHLNGSKNSPVIPQHSESFRKITPKRPQNTHTELLELFEAQRSPTSVTKARRKRTEQQQDMDFHKLQKRQTTKDRISRYGQSLRQLQPQARAFDLLMPSLNRETNNFAGLDDDFDFGDPTKASLASIYSDNFDHQDWAISARPSGFEQKPTSEESSTSEDVEKQPDQILKTPDRTTPTGKVLRPRSALSGNAAQVGFKYQRDSPFARSVSTPRRKLTSAPGGALPGPSVRSMIRQQISDITKKKRDRFVYHHRSKFLPLLPTSNYVARLNGQVSPIISAYQDVAQPQGVNATLKPYQLKGLSFLLHMHRNGMPAILGDEMGLGKTLQTLSLFQYLKEQEGLVDVFSTPEMRPFLVICPLTVLENWVSEARKFTPQLKVFRFHGPASERALLKDDVRKKSTHLTRMRKAVKINWTGRNRPQNNSYDLVITTYDTFKSEVGWFRSAFVWRYVVLDEGHHIKNYKSNIARLLQTFNAEYRMILTGTPLQNNLVEMWSLLHWLLPDIFVENTLPFFKNAFDLTKGLVDRAVLDASRQLLELVMLRRMKNSPGVDLNLPPKYVVRLFVPLTLAQKKWYLKLLTQQSDDMLEDIYRSAHRKEKDSSRLTRKPKDNAAGSPSTPDLTSLRNSEIPNASDGSSPRDSWRRLLNLVLQLRKVCTHPYLMPDAAPAVNVIGPHVYEQSGKFMALYKLIQELVLHQGRKIIIFSNFTKVLDWAHHLIMYASDEGAKFQCLRLDGSAVRAKRNLYVRLFQRLDSDFKIFLISTKAGGIGLNLTAATAAVFLDEDWNPQVDLQAEARCHRIGQKNPVTIYKLCTAGTVEQQMLGRIHKKLYLSAKITEAMQNVYDTPALTEDHLAIAQSKALFGNYSEFKSLLRRGTRTLAGGDVDAEEMLKWDFSTMLERCQQKFDPTDEDGADEDTWLTTMERVECAVFDGQRYARERVEMTEYHQKPLSSRQDRHKGKEMTVEIDGFFVNKASLGCAQWEAMPTLAGKDPSLQEVKKTKIDIKHQKHCQICHDDCGTMFICSNCPRTYHAECMDFDEVARAKEQSNWNCMQHSCYNCKKKAAEAGGMIFRCRWCASGYCEDCLDWDACTLVGDNIQEYKILDFPEKREAYYIVCPDCNRPKFQSTQDNQTQLYRDGASRIGAGKIPGLDMQVTVDPGFNLTPTRSKENGQETLVESIERHREYPSRLSITPPLSDLSVALPTTPDLTSGAQPSVEPWVPLTPVTPVKPFSSLALSTPRPSSTKRKARDDYDTKKSSPTKRRQKERYEIEV